MRTALTRRSLLRSMGASALSLPMGTFQWNDEALAQTAAATGASAESLERTTGILTGNASIDLHTHLGYWEAKGTNPIMVPSAYRGDASTLAVIQAMLDGGCKSAWVNLTGDVPVINLGQPGNKARDYQPGQAWAEYERQRAILNDFFDRFPIERAMQPVDVERISRSGRLAVFLSTEGGHMIEDDLDKLSILRSDGLSKFQPIHYVHTKLGDNQTDPSVFGGLSPTGKEAIRQASKLGMVIDAAHASYDAAKHMADLTVGPIVLSHTMMKFGPYLATRPRFITRDYAFLIAETGGVIGTWTVGEPYGVKDLKAFTEAVSKLVDTVGIDHVGWSTDYISFAMPEWFNDYTKFQVLCAGLLDAGFSDSDLVKFVGGNALRVLETVRDL